MGVHTGGGRSGRHPRVHAYAHAHRQAAGRVARGPARDDHCGRILVPTLRRLPHPPGALMPGADGGRQAPWHRPPALARRDRALFGVDRRVRQDRLNPPSLSSLFALPRAGAGAAGERRPAVGAELTASHRAFPGGGDVAHGAAAVGGDGHAHAAGVSGWETRAPDRRRSKRRRRTARESPPRPGRGRTGWRSSHLRGGRR